VKAWASAPTLVGRHVTLRPLDRDDRAALLDAAGDGALHRLFYTGVPSPETIDGYLDTVMAERDYGRAMPFAVLDANGGVIGSTRFLRMSREHRRVEIGATFYRRSAQRSAVNTEAKLLLLGHAFDVLGCHVVQIRTDWFNRRSQAAIERLGAKRDGVLRNHQTAADGRVRDIVVYSIIASEWPSVRRNLHHLLEQPA
jgi:RimJ/RimL family protein N-acetyltransferase